MDFTTTDFLLIALLWVNLVSILFQYMTKRKSSRSGEQYVPITQEKHRLQLRRTEKHPTDNFYENLMAEQGGETKNEK